LKVASAEALQDANANANATSTISTESAQPLTAKQAEAIALYADGAAVYDRLNRLMSAGTGNWYRKRALGTLGLEPTATVIDLACGTGALALAAQQALPGSPSILAVDPTPEMRAIAAAAGVRDVRAGSFEAIPASPSSYDAVVSAYALRYADSRKTAFVEILRVLRPGGKLLLLEMIVPPRGLRRILARILLSTVGPPLYSLLCRDPAAGRLLTHLWQSISRLEGPEIIVEDLERAGFLSVEYRHVGGLLGEFRGHAPAASAPRTHLPIRKAAPESRRD
jgi:demethylmenaquinone methyltransferase/2-methoxy-6-polyprenyl-1,4-benzoquinol methylase